MKLYYHPQSPYSRKVLLALYEKNIGFERRVVDIFDPAALAEYRREVTPGGKVPLLESAQAKVPESSIIIEYLDAYYDQGPRLIPADRDLARRSRLQDRVADLYLIAPLDSVFAAQKCGEAERARKRSAEAEATSETVLRFLEHQLEGHAFVLGDALTQADLGPSVGLEMAKRLGFDLERYPNVDAWLKKMLARESWAKIFEESASYAFSSGSKPPSAAL